MPLSYPKPSDVTSVASPRTLRYRVFLSYSHADTKWARWLMRRLENYAVPTRFHGRSAPIGGVGRRIAPVFRDRDELPTTSDLGETIRGALRESATLVVICSPSSARSRWVQEEITAFKRLQGDRSVFAFIVSGEPKFAGGEADCFPPALRLKMGADGQLSGAPAEVVAADARVEGDGPKLAFLRLVAGLLGVGFDELRQRELQRRNQRLTLIAAGAALGMAVTLALSIVAWRARSDAQRRQEQAEDVLAFMLGDFRGELQKLGRLDLLTKVGDKAMTYFDALDARDLTDTALARQAKALTQIGEVRLEQKDVQYADAVRAFLAAYQRAASLAARHPKNGDMLFERAQAEFWIGAVNLRRGDSATAASWLTRYRDSTAALVLQNPANQSWQRELVSGHHNLAVLEVERGNLVAARAGFLAQFEPIRRLIAANPKNSELRFKLTDLDSYLGAVAARSGDFAEARRRVASQRAGLEALVAAEPSTAHWTFKLADCLAWEADILSGTGNVPAARASLARGIALVQSMLAHDPKNRRWAGMLALLQLRAAAIAPAAERAEVMHVLMKARTQLAEFAAIEPKDRTNSLRLMTAWRVEAQQRFAAGHDNAADAAAQAVAIGDALVNEARVNDRARGEAALSNVVAAKIAAANRNPAVAALHGRRSLEILAGRLDTSNDCLLLDPAVRALAVLGRDEEARALIERLERLGYVPFEPWPESAASRNFIPQNKTQ